MAKEENIRRYSPAELRAARARGESQSDWDKVRAKTGAVLEADIATDGNWNNVPEDWYLNATPVVPESKIPLSLRLDPFVVDWFKSQGPGYQTRINAVLRAYVEAVKKRA